jgi:hypothetical protein
MKTADQAQALGGIANALGVMAEEKGGTTGAELAALSQQLMELEQRWRDDEQLLARFRLGTDVATRVEHKLLRCGSGIGNPDCPEDGMVGALDELAAEGWTILSDHYDSMAKPPWRLLLRRELAE